jgi:hypothetical protein
LFIYVRFQYGLSPLERYYLPYYVRSEIAGLAHPANAYRMLRITDGKSQGRLAAQDGGSLLYREPLHSYPNKAIRAWIGHWIYGDVPLYGLFKMQLWFGLVAFVLQPPFSVSSCPVES